MVAGQRLRRIVERLAQAFPVSKIPVVRLTSLLLIGAVCGARPCAADEIGDFYAGKTITMLVGYEAGGGYDLYARLAAQFLGRFLPGQPAVIVQNMPGAGGLKAAHFLLDVAPKDGTTLGIPSQTIVFDTLLGYSAGVDAGRFQWLGRLAMNVEVGAAFATTGISSMADLRTREISIGGTGGTAGSSVIPFLLNKLGGTKFKLVEGYRSAIEVILAMRRGELDMVGGVGLATLQARFGSEIKDGSLRVLYQTGFSRHPDIPDVPGIDEFGRTDEEKQMLALLSYIAAVGRSIVAPPGVPPARIAALQKAIAAMLADPAVLTFASEHTIKLEPGSAEDIDAIVRKTLTTSPDLAAKTRAVLETMKTGK
jgi:tripartite-type tricarboxylate transporter receptor subunit TctC